MALIRTPSSSCSVITNKTPYLLFTPPHFLSPYKSKTLTTITNSQNPSTNEPTQPIKQQNQQQEPPNSPGLGFGSNTASTSTTTTSSSSNAAATKKKKKKGKRERGPVIRRSPVEKPAFGVLSKEEKARVEEQSKNESAFLLAWLGFGALILVEGIALAASGFLPEEWDKFFVKYLYPSFTPTVFVFVAGTVFYGVLKYLQNEQLNKQK